MSIVALFLKKFRGSIRWGATEVGEELIRAALCAEAKVADLDTVTGRVEDVLRLNVSVDDVTFMLKNKNKGGKRSQEF